MAYRVFALLVGAAGLLPVPGQAWANLRSKRIIVLVVVVFSTTTFLQIATHAQSFEGLGFLPGGNYSNGVGINADGSVVVGLGNGNCVGCANGGTFRWTQSGGMIGLGVIPGTTQSGDSVGVNADGSVVVGRSSNNGPANPNTGFFSEAFRWTQSGGMIGLGVLPTGLSSQANAVSADGSVVVGSTARALGGGFPCCDEAFRWTQSGGMVGLGFLPGGDNVSVASALNSDGSVVVGSSFNPASGNRAFRWTQSGGMVSLGLLNGFPTTINSDSNALAVNADGSVVVGAARTGVSANVEAFRWTQSGGMVGLGYLPGGSTGPSPFSSAAAVSADGAIVVGTSQSTSVPGGEAFKWTASTGMQSIKDTLVANGVNMTGWTLTNANGVSADGTVIVGTATTPSAPFGEAWIATIPANAFALLDLQGVDHSIGSLVWGGTVINSGPNNATLTAGSDNTSTTFNGVIQDGTS